METASILVLRKVLDPDIPSHQDIIDRSQPPEDEEEGEGQSVPRTAASQPASNPRSAGQSSRGVKRIKAEQGQSNRAVKTEPGQTASRSQNSGQSAVIDLT